MKRQLNWGVLSTARIGTNKVLPAMQASEHCKILGLASRNLAKAQAEAARLGIPKTSGSYEDLLADPEIEAVYNPLPNHLHVPWSIKALQAGKHVLCEKPIGLSSAEGQKLVDEAKRHPQLKVMEAFMYRHHPQWRKARALVLDGAIGELRTIQTFFSYWNDDPDNIRNQADLGGGGLMDIGCYCISLSRFIFDAEPERVVGIIELDPTFGTDRLTSGMMDFGAGTSTWTCSTQLQAYQRVIIFGTEGRVEIEIPFNAPPDVPCRLWLQRGTETQEIAFEVVDQYTIQGDLFSLSVLEDTPVPTPIEDAVANMKVIEAIITSAKSGTWVSLQA
jgi:predicted dehydrogenase